MELLFNSPYGQFFGFFDDSFLEKWSVCLGSLVTVLAV